MKAKVIKFPGTLRPVRADIVPASIIILPVVRIERPAPRRRRRRQTSRELCGND